MVESYDAKLATLLRMIQWQVDDIAFELPKSTVTEERKESLATNLESAAQLLRSKPVTTIEQ